MREDRRFVVGKGQFVADVDIPNMKHVALVTCPYPAARIKSIDKSAALAMPGVHYVLEGSELAAGTVPLMSASKFRTYRGGRSRSRLRAMLANGSPLSSPTRARWPRTPPSW